MAENILEIKHIDKRFGGTHALCDVSLDLREGEIHALVGENGAGKSTLMNIISGVIRPDSGEVYLAGKKMEVRNPYDAQVAGIGFVHQELALCPDLTVAQNIFMDRMPTKGGFVQKKKLYAQTTEILSQFGESGARIHPGESIRNLGAAQQQLVEIAKAVSLDSKVIIFDEPTSSLMEAEVAKLFEIIRSIVKRGVSVFYISHKLSEIFELCDRVTILRDGTWINTKNVADTDAEQLVQDMVGKSYANMYAAKSDVHDGEEVYRVSHIARSPIFHDISFYTRKGEILGLYGLVGAGRTESVRAACGIDKKQSGKVSLYGKELTINSYADALKNGICYLSDDRKLDGLFLLMSISNNMMAPQIRAFSKNGFVSRRQLNKVTNEYREKLHIKYGSAADGISSLSGGNQQKVMLAKLLATDPKVIILDEPTRGIDVGAKSEIHNLLRTLNDNGMSVIVISSELPEIISLCDRVSIISEGRTVGELTGEAVCQEKIIQMISQNSMDKQEKAV